ncbi:hypothetical protein D3C71_2146210 [compost metagenome]
MSDRVPVDIPVSLDPSTMNHRNCTDCPYGVKKPAVYFRNLNPLPYVSLPLNLAIFTLQAEFVR